MDNDLISRKWLTDAILNRRTYLSYEDAKDVIDLINNAPTVYPICEDKACKYRANERPQGEWIEHSCYKDVIICSNCNSGDSRWHKDFKFCPNCGADMRKGGAE